MIPKYVHGTLAAAGACALALVPATVTSGNGTFDPLLDGGAYCATSPTGAPLVMRALVLAAAETAPFQPVPPQPALDAPPVLYTNLGTLTFKAGTRNPKAQAWFDQGLRLAFGFNHAEAQRAFREAQKADPGCALCFWGESLILGPQHQRTDDAGGQRAGAGGPRQGGRTGAEGAAARPRAHRCARDSATRPIPRRNGPRSMPPTRAQWSAWRSSIRPTTPCRRCTPRR